MVIKINKKAYNKMIMYAKQMEKSEIGGLILGTIDINGNILVKDVILLKQCVTNGTFQIDNNAMNDFTKNSSSTLLSMVIGWWHSHCNFGTFWSNIDIGCSQRLAKLMGRCLSIVISGEDKNWKNINIRCKLDIKNKDNTFFSIDNINPELPNNVEMEVTIKNYHFNNNVNEIKKIKNDIKENVQKVELYTVEEVCPTCNGFGVVERKRGFLSHFTFGKSKSFQRSLGIFDEEDYIDIKIKNKKSKGILGDDYDDEY
jgi:proteasome lid subunit RPN8/RPN11